MKGNAKTLKLRVAKPEFRSESPFASDSQTSYQDEESDVNSPAISPKTVVRDSAWTSVNGSTSLSTLKKPRYLAAPLSSHRTTKGNGSIRENRRTSTQKPIKVPKRRRSSTLSKDTLSDTSNSGPSPLLSQHTSRSGSNTESEWDSEDIVLPTTKRARQLGPAKYVNGKGPVPRSTPRGLPADDGKGSSEPEYTADDYEVAALLCNLQYDPLTERPPGR